MRKARGLRPVAPARPLLVNTKSGSSSRGVALCVSASPLCLYRLSVSVHCPLLVIVTLMSPELDNSYVHFECDMFQLLARP